MPNPAVLAPPSGGESCPPMPPHVTRATPAFDANHLHCVRKTNKALSPNILPASSILLSTTFPRALHSIPSDLSILGDYSTRPRHLQAPRQTAVCRFGDSFLTISVPIARLSTLLIRRFASGAATGAEFGAP